MPTAGGPPTRLHARYERAHSLLTGLAFVVCLGAPQSLLLNRSPVASLIAAATAMLLWQTLGPPPYRIMLHFMMWLAVIVLNAGTIALSLLLLSIG